MRTIQFIVTVGVMGLAGSARAGTGQASVFFTQEVGFASRGIARIAGDGTEHSTLFTLGFDNLNLRDVAFDAQTQRVYWRHGTAGEFDLLRTANTDGSDQQIIDGFPTNSFAVAVGPDLTIDQRRNRLYWVDPIVNRIASCRLDGTGYRIPFGSFESVVQASAVDAASHQIYFTHGADITRVNPDGSGVQIVVPAHRASRIAIDHVNGGIYWLEAGSTSLFRADLDGSNVASFLNGAVVSGASSDLAIDPVGGHVYWSDGELDRILRAPLAGGPMELVHQAPAGTNISGIHVQSVPAPGAACVLALALAARRRRRV